MGAGCKICASQQWNNFLLFAMPGQRMGMWSFVASSDGCRTVPVFSRAGKWELFPAPPLCKGLPSLNSTHVSSIPHYWKFLWQEGQFSVTKEVLEHEWISWIQLLLLLAASLACFWITWKTYCGCQCYHDSICMLEIRSETKTFTAFVKLYGFMDYWTKFEYSDQ